MSIYLNQELRLPLRCVFMGRENGFDKLIVRWLARQMTLAGIVWADANRYTWAWRRKWFRRAIKHRGLLHVLDEIRFRHWVLNSQEIREGMKLLLEDIRSIFSGYHDPITPAQKQKRFSNVNAPDALDYVRSCRPDVLFIVCISQIIKPELAGIAPFGTFIFHEGVTPEYRGVHTPYWAIANEDDNMVGCTLLKINEVIDGGPAFVQKTTRLDTLRTPLGYIGHAALAEGLEEVAQFLKALDDGTAQSIDTTGRQDGYYSYFGYSQLKKIFARRRERGIVVGPEQISSFHGILDI